MLYKVIKIPKWTPRFILRMLFGEEVDCRVESFNGDCVVPDGCTLIQNKDKVFSNVFLGNAAVLDKNGYRTTINGTLDATGSSCELIDSKGGSNEFTFSEWEGSKNWSCSKCGEQNVPDNHSCVKNWKQIENRFIKLSIVFGKKINFEIIVFVLHFFKSQFKEVLEEMVRGEKEFFMGGKDIQSVEGYRMFRQEMLDKINKFFE